MAKLLLRPTEVADALGIGRTKTYELIATGTLPSIKIGNRPRVPVEALEQWIQEQLGPRGIEHEPPEGLLQEKQGRRGGNHGER